jgi:APA family basic amino acid/polyamine antiporter
MPRFTREHLFHIRPVGSLVEETHESGHELKRAVGPVSLTALGVGAIVGTGIFVVVGEGLARAGPAVVLSFVLAAITCLFSALSYAELASSIPVAGSAYTYAYATLGEIVAWVIGWDLILEYGGIRGRDRGRLGRQPECLPRDHLRDSPTGEVDDLST